MRDSGQSLLQSEGFSDDAALDQAIKKLEADLKRTRKKAANDGDDVIVNILIGVHELN
jgi:actin-related protein 5